MKLSNISIRLLAIIVLILASLVKLPDFNVAYANNANLNGTVYMNFNGARFHLKGVYLEKYWRCTNQPLSCQQGPFTHYSRDDGKYFMDDFGYTTVVDTNGQLLTNCRIGIGTCGLNCGENPYQIRAVFPGNFNKNNFPVGVDYSRGKWVVHMSEEVRRIDGSAILTDSNGNQLYIGNLGNDSGYSGLDFEWVPDPLPIAGEVIDSQTGRGVGGVNLEIINDQQPPTKITTTTDSEGKFSANSKALFKNSTRYAVRTISVPSSHLLESLVVTTTQWSWINLVSGGRNAAPPDKSYEQQDINNSGCAGAANDPSKFPHQVGRCNFQLDPIPQTPSPTSTITRSPTSTPPVTITLGPTSTITVNPQCTQIPLSNATVTAITINHQRVDFTSFATVPVKLDGTAGQVKKFIIPIAALYSNGACRAFILVLSYDPNATPGSGTGTPTTTPTPPDPKLCAQDTNRPNGCACTQNVQCANSKCDPASGSICISEPFIQTQGGDVHSNEGVQGR